MNTLAGSRDLSRLPWVQATLTAAQNGKATGFQVSQAIDAMKAQPWLTPKSAQPTAPLVPAGFYQLDGVIYKVRPGKANPSHRYAMAFQVTGQGKGSYSYEAGKGKIAKLTLAQAAEMGHQTGVCCICGRELTDPNSVAMGIGPICIQKGGF
jgi:hypothetical protein